MFAEDLEGLIDSNHLPKYQRCSQTLSKLCTSLKFADPWLGSAAFRWLQSH